MRHGDLRQLEFVMAKEVPDFLRACQGVEKGIDEAGWPWPKGPAIKRFEFLKKLMSRDK